ncbi:Protein prenylyltransferase superfamily protein [Perilla frutescens var. hirtella]|nr:Protein prenylyltransferase superfamily protein [Perilla frutescens var. hirtella]KAH6816399.1 Protein prenylyltransferase superfamily protein [Perilla frutescens var. frutescens]
MNSTLSINASISSPLLPPPLSLQSSAAPFIRRPIPLLFSHKNLAIKAAAASSSSSANPTPSKPPHPIIPHLKAAACAVIFAAAAFSKFPTPPAKAEIPTPSQTLTETLTAEDTKQEDDSAENSPLTQLLESSSDAIDALKNLLQEKLAAGEDGESLSILRKLSAAQPDNPEWKFMIARLLNELGKIEEARDAFEEILSQNPLCFEALFENALLMDRSGEREAVMQRLEAALGVAESEMKEREARDVKLIMAQMQFLQKNVEEALRSYDELAKEDPTDFRPYFCKGMIYSLMDKNAEARQQFAKYRELSPKKYEVEGYLRTPLSRMKLFGTDEEN